MGILKTLSVAHKRDPSNRHYSILLTKTPATNQPCLIFEAGTVVCLNPDEAEQVRRNGGYEKILDGYACLGMLQFAHEGSREILFLVIVKGCTSIGKVQNSEVFCITDVALLSMRCGPNDAQLVKDVKKLISSGCFYFSHPTMAHQQAIDLTLCAQRAHMTTNTDNRFFWNRLLHRHFERYGIDTRAWLVKVMCGGININTVYIGGVQAKACVISRLSCERAGTRFNVRGVNDLGHVANFVETEQVLFINQLVLSFVTIRGSIPLFWEQPGVQVGSHRIKMSRGSEISQAAYDKHMFLLKERYDNVVLINLLSSRESELTLNQLFNAHHKASHIGSEFAFINFDYHVLAARGHRDNLEKLYAYELDNYCDQYGFFHANAGEALQLQRGVFRVNCLDCLDRTNSMQTFIGMKMLHKIVSTVERVDMSKVLPRLLDVYAQSWTHNGDQVSTIYAGTAALEGKNRLKDGTVSVVRTIQSNFLDADKQDAFDIVIFSRTLNRDYSYRAVSLLPHYYIFASPSLLVNMCDRYLEYCNPQQLRITVATWNVNGGRHFDNIMHNRARPVSDWLVDYKWCAEYKRDATELLESNRPVDLYAIGFQEIVDLNATNIVASSTQNQRDWLQEIQKTISRDHKYLLVTSVQLVGVCLFVFIRAPLAPYLRDICNDQVKTGLGGTAGNKGGVAVRLRYKASSLCFVCAHFAAGQHQVKERNDDYAEITRRIQFPMGRSINSHDYVFWCGDFNYRLDKISNDEVRRAAAAGEFELLQQFDQLKLSQAAGQTFKGYVEGDITFPPTYKYDTNSNDYDTSEKCRVPAYTDRILFKKRHETHLDEELTDKSQIKFYNRIELMSSDHRPVVAEYEIEVLEVDKRERARVFDSVLQENGPPDSTVFVKVDGHLDIAEQDVFAAILKLLADEAGEIVLVRYVASSLMIIFSDGKSALKALNLDGCPIGEHLPDNKLIISLRTNNWPDVIRRELASNIDNTVNLSTGAEPTVHLEDDEDETAEELNMSIGPDVNSDSICLQHDVFLGAEQAKQQQQQNQQSNNLYAIASSPSPVAQQQPPPVPPKSPMHLPSRPPPPPPVDARPPRLHTPLTPSRVHHAIVTPTPTNMVVADANANYANGGDAVATPKSGPVDAFGFAEHDTIAGDMSSFGDASSFAEQPSIDLANLSLSSEFESSALPPPAMAAPILQPLTPSRLPPALPPKSPMGNIPRPSRAAPPPPVPPRHANDGSGSSSGGDGDIDGTTSSGSDTIQSAQI